jgi:O-acetylhomoserine (thiol)-lyase
MDSHCENALAVATYLKGHPKVSWVRYPGLESDPMYELNQKYLKGKGGSVVVFGIQAVDGRKAGQDFINSLRLFSHVANVGKFSFFWTSFSVHVPQFNS